MSHTLTTIQAPIAFEMKEFEKKFRQLMKSNVLLLDKIMGYIVKRKGKQMRPMFVFLSAGVTGKISESTYRGASLIELLHTATLVHDDVVDDADYRRGFFSINALWKNSVMQRKLELVFQHNRSACLAALPSCGGEARGLCRWRVSFKARG